MSDLIYNTFSESDLRHFATLMFKAINCNEKDALLSTDVLINADLRGIDSHGLARLSGYVRLYEAGRINTQANIQIIRSKKGNFTLDADGALGLVSAPRAMEIVLENIPKYGSSFAAIGNSNHFGIAAYHAMKALEIDCIGMSMTNASPLVAPTLSKERMLGTNPICYAIPSGNEIPFVLDMATSAAANGKLEIAERKNSPVPLGWLENKNGESTDNPKDLKAGGHLLPLGSDLKHGSHKGYGLSALVDIMSGVLSGANYGPWVPPFVAFLPVLPDLPGKGLGHFVGAMEVDGFMEVQTFKDRMDHWINRFKHAESSDPKQTVIIPGEPEYHHYLERKKLGIPIIDKVCNDLKTIAEKYKISHPFN